MSACLVPVVERAGGRVLVRANVEKILVEGGKACGVRRMLFPKENVVSSWRAITPSHCLHAGPCAWEVCTYVLAYQYCARKSVLIISPEKQLCQ